MVVYLTRPTSGPAAGASLKRTAIHKLVGITLQYVSHTEVPDTPWDFPSSDGLAGRIGLFTARPSSWLDFQLTGQ